MIVIDILIIALSRESSDSKDIIKGYFSNGNQNCNWHFFDACINTIYIIKTKIDSTSFSIIKISSI